ncbi:MAG: signal recognition particle subunit SRP19/SEC65 family protein [Candidatus Nezhaarchaeales archaeon]
MPKEAKIRIYTAYLDSSKTKRDGRRVPRRLAVDNPRVEELITAASLLGLNPVRENVRYSKSWWEELDAVKVDKKMHKQQLLKLLAEKVKELRRSP